MIGPGTPRREGADEVGGEGADEVGGVGRAARWSRGRVARWSRERTRRIGGAVALAVMSVAGAVRGQGVPPAAPPAPAAAPEVAPPLRGLVMLFAAPSAEALAGRLEAELVAAGFVPRRVMIPAAAPFGDLAGIASAARAEGAIRVEPDASGAEVWVTDGTTGRTRLRQSLSADASPALIPVIALRTVEFLRASLLPAEAPPPAAPAPAVVATPPTPQAPSRSRLRGWLAPAWLASPGGADRTISAAGGASFRLLPHLGLEALALVPLSAARFDATEGETHLAVYLAGAGAQVRGSTGSWTGDVGAGALGAFVRATGTPRMPSGGFVGATQSMAAVAPYARAGLALGVASWLALRADFLLGALTPRPTIGVVTDAITRDAASWGRPFGALFVGVQGGGS